MKHNIIRKIFYNVKTDPRSIFIFLALILIIPIKITKNIYLTLIEIILLIICFFMYHYCKRDVTPYFHIFHFGKVNYIFQNRKIKHYKIDPNSCNEIVIYLKNNLLETLPKGVFIALTHKKIIDKLEKAGNVKLLYSSPACNMNLLSLKNKLFGCKKCCKYKNCEHRKKEDKSCLFFYIKFIKV